MTLGVEIMKMDISYGLVLSVGYISLRFMVYEDGLSFPSK